MPDPDQIRIILGFRVHCMFSVLSLNSGIRIVKMPSRDRDEGNPAGKGAGPAAIADSPHGLNREQKMKMKTDNAGSGSDPDHSRFSFPLHVLGSLILPTVGFEWSARHHAGSFRLPRRS